MKGRLPNLPVELRAFIDQDHTTFHCDDGDWDLKIEAAEKSDLRKHLPKGSTIIAENGCGDFLFMRSLKRDPRVYVYWHEEDRDEVFSESLGKLIGESSSPRPESEEIPSDSKGAMSLKDFEAALGSPEARVRTDAIREFEKTAFTLEALPALRRALSDESVVAVIHAAQCIARLGPEAAVCPAGQQTVSFDREGVNLMSQLLLTGSKVWGYSHHANCYSACLNALVKLKFEDEYLVDFIHSRVGGCNPDELIDSLEALKTVGTAEAIDLLKRTAIFSLPELNMKYAKQVKKIVDSAKAAKK